MRFLAAFALLLACGLGHASASICPDEIAYTNSGTNECPGYRTNIGTTNVGQTSVTLTGTIDAQGAGSTHYHWTSVAQFPPGCTSLNYTYAHLTSSTPATRQAAIRARQKCMLWPTMVAGTGATSYGSAAVPSAGLYSLGITGLTQGTTYYTQDFNMHGLGGTGKVSVMATTPFTTLATGGGGPGEQTVADSGASPRFIGNGGNDLSDGLTHATRWASLSKITCGLPAGTNVGIFNTSVFTLYNAHINICHNGTSNDWSMVGSYKLNGSSVPIWTLDNTNGIGTTDQKAELQGGITTTCLDANSCNWSLAGHQAGGQDGIHDPVITVTSNYVNLRNIEIYGWHSNAVHAYGSGKHHFLSEGVDVYLNGGSGFAITDGYQDWVWRNSTVRYIGLCIQMRNLGGPGTSYGCPAGFLNAAGVASRALNTRGLVENNEFSNGIAETFDAIQGSSHVIIRGNRSYAMESAGWYADGASDIVFENNISMGGIDYGWNNAGATTGGIGVQASLIADIEFWQNDTSRSPENYMGRNNLQVRPGTCVSMSLSQTAIDRARNVGMWILGNTCIGAGYAQIHQWTIPDARIQRFHVKSNAFWDEVTETASFAQPATNKVITHNHVYAAFEDSDLNGTSQTTGDPQLVTVYATWATYKAPTWPAWTDARPAPGSPLIDSGVVLESTVLNYAAYGWAATQMADVLSGAITLENWAKERYYSATNEVLGATPPRGAMCPAAGC